MITIFITDRLSTYLYDFSLYLKIISGYWIIITALIVKVNLFISPTDLIESPEFLALPIYLQLPADLGHIVYIGICSAYIAIQINIILLLDI